MTPEQLDEIEQQVNEFGEESGFILPLVKALRGARALLQSVALVCRGAKEPDQADLSVLGNVLRERDEARAELEHAVAEGGALYEAKVSQSEAEQECDELRAEVERLREAARQVHALSVTEERDYRCVRVVEQLREIHTITKGMVE